MSLVSTAATWTNDDPPKKRVSTIRKTIRAKPLFSEDDTAASQGQPSELSPSTIDSSASSYYPSKNAKLYSAPNLSDMQKETDERNARVNRIINEMNMAAGENDGAGLADFRPPPQPEINVFKHEPADMANFMWKGTADDSTPIADQKNKLQHPVPHIQRQMHLPGQKEKGHDAANSKYGPIYPIDPNYSNYHMSYVNNGSNASNVANGSNASNRAKVTDTKLLEKINYMIQLLEKQDVEKTAHITEEFVLYTFLGVFMIFVLDSFVRGGKYTR